uniref:Uncharacterized protein n=1 Tax=Tanacetum cinerariifolium TaxID=118510 RepID=A0A6L2ML11_TANCI|nr:hypothetical protein [Tanacetum cinerariifolium]
MTLNRNLVTSHYFLLIYFDYEENATKEKRNSVNLLNGDSNNAGGEERTIRNCSTKTSSTVSLELALLYPRMILDEEKMIERLYGLIVHEVNNKRQREDDQGRNSCQQQNMSWEVVRIYAAAVDQITRKTMLELYRSATHANFIITTVPA